VPRNRALPPTSPPTDDPTTIWSTWVQSVEWIDPDRERRFRDEVRDILWPVLGLRRGGTAVDVGCGGGALTRSLARWMGPRCTVYGIDRDANFLDYARRRAREERLARRARYLQGDALALPLPDDSAHAVTSYTVTGHIPDTRAFLREKIRVCRPGGRVSVMEVRSEGSLGSSPTRSAAPTQRERDLWKPLEKAFLRGVHRLWKVGATPVGLAELPALFEDLGLQDIMLDAFAVTHSLDDARLSEVEARRHLQAQEDWLLAAADHSASLLDRRLPRGHLASLKRCIRARFRKQRRWLDSGLHTWDFSIGLSWIVSGRLPAG
jgi:ubiquinone/menaquinone biosynthesis C-methylase UbiE